MLNPNEALKTTGQAHVYQDPPLPLSKSLWPSCTRPWETYQPRAGLSRLQRYWLSVGLMGILVSNSVCWARCERASLGHYSLAA